MVSAFPELEGSRVTIAVAVVTFMTLANLRAAPSSPGLFAGPTFLYILALGMLVGVGLRHWFTGDLAPLPVDQQRLDDLTGGAHRPGSLASPVRERSGARSRQARSH